MHEWKDRTEESRARYVRARRLNGLNRWVFHSRWQEEVKGRAAFAYVRGQAHREEIDPETDWVELDPPPREDVAAFVDVLERKYRRKRVPHMHLAEAKVLLESYGAAPAEPDADDIQEVDEWDED